MDAAVIAPPHKLSHFAPPRLSRRIAMHDPRRPNSIRSVLVDNNLDPSPSKTSYNDSWFDLIAINHLSHSLQSSAGVKSEKRGYGGLVEATAMVSRRFNQIQQRELVMQTLHTAFPAPILLLIRRMMPPSKLAREFFAVFTTIFFPWLVGPCKVKESEFEGRREKNVVHIPKCRLLEETNCVGMCTNLCKMPTQSFIKDSFGMPINMVPTPILPLGHQLPQTAVPPLAVVPPLAASTCRRYYHLSPAAPLSSRSRLTALAAPPLSSRSPLSPLSSHTILSFLLLLFLTSDSFFLRLLFVCKLCFCILMFLKI